MRRGTLWVSGCLLFGLSGNLPSDAAAAGELCQRATAEALSVCLKEASRASIDCFKNTGMACAADDERTALALDAVDTALASCVDQEAVAAAGYAPLTPSQLTARYRNACSRETEAIAARTFGGPAGPLLAAAPARDRRCLLRAAREAGDLLAKSLRQLGKCAGKACNLDRIEARLRVLAGKSAAALERRCEDLESLIGLDPHAFVDEAASRVATATAAPCDPLNPAHCLFPFTNDYFSVGDPSSASGRRLALAVEAMPSSASGVPIDPTWWNVIDGFSVGPVMLMDDQQLDLASTGATPITNVATSLEPAAPVALIDALTGERQLIWVERDQSGAFPEQRPIMIRVGRNLANGRRYIVALRNLRDASGGLLEPSPAFAAYRDRTPTGQLPVEARRRHMEDVFSRLDDAGIARADLYLAWDFTTQSRESTAAKLLKMRDDAFDNVLGSAAPSFTVTSIDEPLDTGIFRRVDGTFQSPLYLADGGVPGSLLRLGPDGLPLNEGDFFTANFRCLIPFAATTEGGAPAVPARAALYGHGLLGSESETSASHVRALSSEHNFVICGTAWTGFMEDDEGTVISVLLDFSNFPKFIQRQHQGILNFMVLARLLTHPDGFASNPAFQVGGESVIDPSGVFYDGNSQGGIMGGVLAAFSQDIERFVLGVPGINYSTLLRRSIDFDLFNVILEATYPNGYERAIILATAQIMWDQTDPSGHIRHVTADTYPNTPPKKILYHVAFGDHQVAPVSVEVAARSNGAFIHQPALSSTKVVPDVTPYYGLPAIPVYPFDGSAVIIWDSGNPAPPVGNVPPPRIEPTDPEWADLMPCPRAFESDPHECPRRQPEARLQKSEFLKNGGMVIDVCSGGPCLAPSN